MDKNITSSHPDAESESFISLPIKKQELGSFISGLLGQKQTIERAVYTKFDIDHSWFVNLHHTINQRIMQQSNAHLVGFSAVVYFEDGLKRTIDTYSAFESYSETKSLRTIGIKIIWKYLVNFPNKDCPENQQISFEAFSQKMDFIVKSNKNIMTSLQKSFMNSLLDLFPMPDIRSYIKYQIDHTERTWGDDIESIIHGQVESSERETHPSFWIVQAIRVLMIPILFYAGWFIHQKFAFSRDVMIKSILSQYESINSTINMNLISEKMDFLAEMVSLPVRSSEIISFFVTIGTMLSIIVFIGISSKRQYSFISLTRKSNQYREKMIKKESRSTLIIIGSFVLSVCASVVANYLSGGMT